MLKTVGASGQISLGKKFAGQHYEVQFAESGAVTLSPVTVLRGKPAISRRKPKFHVVKVDKIIKLSRDELHERRAVS